jgi:hypothetical protein
VGRLVPVALVALAVAIHAPTFAHEFVLDDGVMIVRNPAVTRGAPLSAYFLDRETTSSRPDYNTRIWRPLRAIAMRLVVAVAGVRPIGFAVVNLLLYVLSALMVLRLASAVGGDRAAAAWATALWVALPVHVEPVTYAQSIGDMLSLALELAALVVALPLLEANARPRPLRIAGSALLALGGMLAKEMAVTAPALVVLLALARQPAPWRSPAVRRLVVAHAVVALAYLALRTHVVAAVGQEPITRATLFNGLRDAPWLLAHYVLLTVAPLEHAASYHVAPPGLVAWLLSVVATVLVLILAWRWRRGVAIGLAWFALSLLPVLHLVPLWADLADRFALFPSIGLALALAAALTPLRRPIVVALLAVGCLVYGAASIVEARPWRSDSLLWRYAVDRQPEAPLARSNLAAVLLGEGRVDEAAAQLDALHALGYTRADTELKRAWVYARIGRKDDAARALAASLREESMGTTAAQAHALAGQLALDAGDAATATRELVAARAQATAQPSVGLLGYLVLRARGDASVAADDARIDYLRALEALSFHDAGAAATAARACLRHSPGRVQCEAALGDALTLQAPLTDESRALLEHCLAALPEGSERDHCQVALWRTRGR